MVVLAVYLLASALLLSSVAECSVSKQHRPHAVVELEYDYTINVDPASENAVNDKTCHAPDGGGTSSVPCQTLDYALAQLVLYEPNRSVKFYLASPDITYNLSLPQLNVTNRCHFSLYGNDSLYPLIPTVKCKRNAGVSFTNCCNIVLYNVQFQECGALHVSTSRNRTADTKPHKISFLIIGVSLYFYNCTNVKMYHIGVVDSYQATGVVMYDTNGIVNVTSCVFKNNTVPNDGSVAGGGGFAVEFTYCRPGDITCNQTNYDSKHKRNRNSVYLFDNCTFEDNVANKASTERNFILPAYSNHDATGRGGGLSVYVKGDAVNNSITVVGSRFINNCAMWGGGIRIQMSDSTINNSISLFHCNFTENQAVFAKYGKYTGGGAIHVLITTHFLNDIDDDVSRSKIHINSCILEYNEAMEGGAMCIAIAPENWLDEDQLVEISISKSSFEYNQARLGNAVAMLNFPVFNRGLISNVKFHDCNFSNNSIMLSDTTVHPAGMATVYTNKVSAIFQNSVVFYNNSGSALVVIGTQVDFTGTNAMFQNNLGVNGGAIALLGASSILIGPNTNMTFLNNTATRYGGAIYNRYIGDEDLESTADCFLRYSEPFVDPSHWKVKFNFSDNSAKEDGCSIASTSVYPCAWNQDYFNITNVFHWNAQWHYKNSKCDPKNEFFTRAKNFTQSKSDPIPFYPGRAFTLPLKALDEFGNDVTDDTVYSASVLEGHGQSVAKVDPGFTYVASNYISLSGKPQSNITIVMETTGSRTVHVLLNLTILDCPPGFVLKQTENKYQSDGVKLEGDFAKKTVCECPDDENKYRNLLRCSTKEFMTKIHINYWYGPVNITLPGSKTISTPFLMGMAPITYRLISEDMKFKQDDVSIRLPNSTDGVEKLLCGNANRKGVLCGECLEGYAVAVNSPTYKCVPCSLNSTTTAQFVGHLFAYIALTYVPIVIIFIVIIFFKIKLASSAAAGFLLYAQIISSGYFDITGYSLFYVGINHRAPVVVQSIYSTIYGIFNLESFANFLHPFCLNEHFTTLHILCLDYAIATFPLVVITVIYLFYKCKSLKCHCRAFGRRQETTIDPDASSTTSLLSITNFRTRRKNSPNNRLIHALMAFVLLSYTKFSLASMRTLIIHELFSDTGKTITHRIYMAGHLSFKDTQYIFPFGFLAILILVFVVFLPPLLLLGPLQFVDWLTDKPKFTWLRNVWPSIAIHTFLDTLQGYKPNRRFFAGLYLLFRLFMFLTYSFTNDFITQYTIQQIIIFIFAVLVSLLRPYTKDFFNFLDTFLFLNLGILNAIAIYTSERSYSDSIYGFECFLVFLPLVYIICYVFWNKCRKRYEYKILKHKVTHHLINPLRESCKSKSEERQRLLPFSESVDYSSADDPDEDIFRRAERGNRFRTADIRTVPPKISGEVPKTVISIPDTRLSTISEEQNNSKEANDSGIGRQSNSGGLNTENSENDI